jgi:hypothetical protein
LDTQFNMFVQQTGNLVWQKHSYPSVSGSCLGPDAGYTDGGFRFCPNAW